MQDRSCDGDALLFAAGELVAAFSHLCVVPVWLGGDELMCFCGNRCTDNFIQGCLKLTVTDVFGNRAVKEEDILMDHADMAT